jgi:hypothetical protein
MVLANFGQLLTYINHIWMKTARYWLKPVLYNLCNPGRDERVSHTEHISRILTYERNLAGGDII